MKAPEIPGKLVRLVKVSLGRTYDKMKIQGKISPSSETVVRLS
jgi:hypothetical protein